MSPIKLALMCCVLLETLTLGGVEVKRSSLDGFMLKRTGEVLLLDEAVARLEARAKPRPGLVRLEDPALERLVDDVLAANAPAPEPVKDVRGLEIAAPDVPRLDVAVDDELLADVLVPPANDTEEASPHAEAAVCTHCKGGTRRTKGICTGCTGYAVNAYIDGADVLGISDLTEPARIAACYQLAGLLKDCDISEPTVLGVEKLINRILRGAEAETSVRCRAQLRRMRTGEVS